MLDESLEVDGFTAPGWGRVRDAFAENFARRGETGAAVCVYHDGRPVADLAAGTADPVTGRAYTWDTVQPVMSVS
jgi:CubicO group peptidase (beta-lactamase class C family)